MSVGAAECLLPCSWPTTLYVPDFKLVAMAAAARPTCTLQSPPTCLSMHEVVFASVLLVVVRKTWGQAKPSFAVHTPR